MKTIKIIDLYMMVSKGEQPKKFKYRNEWWAYSIDDYDFRTLKQEYRDADMPTYEYLMSIIDTSNLNDEVEMIEDEFEDIEKTKSYEDFEGIDDYIEHLKNKINSLIKNQKKIINELKNK